MTDSDNELGFLFQGMSLRQKAATVWTSPCADWVSHLKLESRVERLDRSQRFRFEGDNDLILVLNGFIDLFIHPENAEGVFAVPRFLSRVEAGHIGFTPLSTAFATGAFEVSPSMDCEFVRISWDEANAIKDTEAFEQCIEQWLSDWLENLELPIATHAKKITLNEPMPWPAGTHVTASEFCWVIGNLMFSSTESEARWVPLSLHNCAEITEQVQPLSTKDWLNQNDFPHQWQLLNQTLVDETLAQIRQRADHLQSIDQVRSITSHTKYLNSVRELTHTISEENRFQQFHDDPLVSAFLHLANVNELDLHLDERDIRVALKQPNPLKALSQVGRTQLREVPVNEALVRQGYSGILVFDENDTPFTLIHRSKNRYLCFGNGQVHVYDKTFLERLKPVGYLMLPQLPEKASPWQLLWYSNRGLMAELRLVVICALCSALLSILPPIITGRVVGYSIPNAEISQLVVYITALAGLGLTTVALGTIQNMSLLRSEGAMSYKLETAVWNRLLHLPSRFFQDYTAGDLANRAAGINQIRQKLGSSTIAGLLQGMTALVSFGMMFYYQWKIALIGLLIAVVYLIFIYIAARRLLVIHRQLILEQGQLQGLGVQILSAISKLKSANAITIAFSRWNRRYSEILTQSYNAQRISNRLKLVRSLFHFLAFIGLIATVSFQGHVLFAFFTTPTSWAELKGQSATQIISTAHFMAFNVALGQFMAAIFTVSESAVNLLSLKPDIERIQPILKTKDESSTDSQPVFSLNGAVSINHVSFRYNDDTPLILDDITLDIKPGEYVAVVGYSGSGKSTLMRLLLGFETPQHGSIQYDKIDLAAINLQTLRKQLGVVLQNKQLISGTVRDNLSAGRVIPDERLWQALEIAGLKDVVNAMPMKLETLVSSTSGGISGGQQQRLMIARALAQEPKILLFDEATSSLDNRTQSDIAHALEELNATRIVIAHRLSTVINADRIVVMDKGKIVEQGSYQELSNNKGLFARLIKYQKN